MPGQVRYFFLRDPDLLRLVWVLQLLSRLVWSLPGERRIGEVLALIS